MSWRHNRATYNNTRSDDHILSVSLQRLLKLLTDGDSSRLDVRAGKGVLSILGDMKASHAAKFVADSGFHLRDTAGFAKLLITLLGEAGLDDYVVEDLVAELAQIDSAEILAIADDFGTAAKTREAAGQDVVDEFIEILTAAGAWPVAIAIARDSTNLLTQSVWDRPGKLRSEARETAVALEGTAAESNVDRVIELTQRWRSIEREMRKDDERNKKRRDPLLGLHIPDQSE